MSEQEIDHGAGHHMRIDLGDDDEGGRIGAVEVDYFGDSVGALTYLEVIDESGSKPVSATVMLEEGAARAIAADLIAAADKMAAGGVA